MTIQYLRDFDTVEASDSLLKYICTFYHPMNAVFIPGIQGELSDEEAENNEVLIEGILCSLNKINYLGTHRVSTFECFSDYYEHETAFVNVLFNVDSDYTVNVIGVFYTSKLE